MRKANKFAYIHQIVVGHKLINVFNKKIWTVIEIQPEKEQVVCVFSDEKGREDSRVFSNNAIRETMVNISCIPTEYLTFNRGAGLVSNENVHQLIRSFMLLTCNKSIFDLLYKDPPKTIEQYIQRFLEKFNNNAILSAHAKFVRFTEREGKLYFYLNLIESAYLGELEFVISEGQLYFSANNEVLNYRELCRISYIMPQLKNALIEMLSLAPEVIEQYKKHQKSKILESLIMSDTNFYAVNGEKVQKLDEQND